MKLRKRLRKIAWSICWDIGDWFMGHAMRLQGPPDETWTTIDVHANCQPKNPGRWTIQSTNVPATFSTGTTTAVSWWADWDSPEDGVYDEPEAT